MGEPLRRAAAGTLAQTEEASLPRCRASQAEPAFPALEEVRARAGAAEGRLSLLRRTPSVAWEARKGTNRHRRRTSGFRVRKRTATGSKVLKNRRKKGRKVLAPASMVSDKNGKK